MTTDHPMLPVIPPPSDDNTVWLDVGFDVLQRSQQLSWRFLEKDQNLYDPFGPAGGSVYFRRQSYLGIRLYGRWNNKPFSWFEVTQSALVTMPQVVVPQEPAELYSYYPPSPLLAETGSLHLLPGFGKPDEQGIAVCAPDAQMWVANDGVWEVSMFITVKFAAVNGETMIRTFRFDPEVEVGNRSRPSNLTDEEE